MVFSAQQLEFDRLLAGASEGALTRQAACRLIRASDGEEFASLIQLATQLRDRTKGRRISFSKKVFIPLTNVCRDFCAYCTFRKSPHEPGAHTMTPDEVLSVAEAGARLGCKEALFSLGDRPESAFAEIRGTLRHFGYRTTISYLVAMCGRVLNETGLLPHANPGLMSRSELRMLREFCPSMGLMLENVSPRLLETGMPHANARDKRPDLRLETIEEAGRQKIPFTTGILIGIGETLMERVDSLFAIRELNDRYGHIQEVIIQNFRAKPNTLMFDHPEPAIKDLARTIAVARIVLGSMNVQAPPNLSDDKYPFLLGAGLNDWGGISPLTPDFINPEKPWPHIETLATRTASAGFELKERLSIYPEFVSRHNFVDPRLAPRVRSLADNSGYAKIILN